MAIPVKKIDSVFTIHENQTQVACKVTESVNEETDPDFVKIIWEGNLDLPPNRPEGQEIKITYEYDENQIMKCSFLDVETNKETNVDLSMTKNDEEINSSDSIDKFLVE